MQKESSTTTKSLSNLSTNTSQTGDESSMSVNDTRWVVRLIRAFLRPLRSLAVNELIKNLKEKNFPEVRKWIVSNLDNDTAILLRRIYDVLYDSLVPNSIPSAVLVLAKYQYQAAFVADQEINMLACLTEIMVECEFK